MLTNTPMNTPTRCHWPGNDPLYIAYHDEEWGIPEHNDQKLFELLILEGFQSGLSWITILRKREHFRQAFAHFDVKTLSQWDDKQLAQCLENPLIIRNRLKINAVRANAQAFIQIQEKFGSFDRFIWEYVNHYPITNHIHEHVDLPAQTDLSERMSRDLKKRGFKFVGPTICYSFMQAAGLVNDHLTSCFCYKK
jgi:DNA-3-methyladenine glycosylase I